MEKSSILKRVQSLSGVIVDPSISLSSMLQQRIDHALKSGPVQITEKVNKAVDSLSEEEALRFRAKTLVMKYKKFIPILRGFLGKKRPLNMNECNAILNIVKHYKQKTAKRLSLLE